MLFWWRRESPPQVHHHNSQGREADYLDECLRNGETLSSFIQIITFVVSLATAGRISKGF
jgi:hypothetical protein